MGKYIKKFDTHSDYEDFIETEDFIKPNVSYCIDDVELHYNPSPILWAYELDPGRFILGEISNGVLFMYASVDSGLKWIVDSDGKVINTINPSTTEGNSRLPKIISDINSHFGTSFTLQNDIDKDFEIGQNISSWSIYDKITFDWQFYKKLEDDYYIGVYGNNTFFLIAKNDVSWCPILNSQGTIIAFSKLISGGPFNIALKLEQQGKTIDQSVYVYSDLSVGDVIENWETYISV